jgi:hypothetical protein
MRRGDWLAGLTLGTWAGFLLIYGLVGGVALMLAFGALAWRRRSTAALGGMFLGAGGVLSLVLALANLNCAGLYASDGGSCTPPDLSAFLVAGSVFVLTGLGLSVRSAQRGVDHDV